jgi:subtilisin family serine protease
MLKKRNDSSKYWTPSFLVSGLLLVIFSLTPAALAKSGDQSFEDIRKQSSIAAAYNFNPLPPNAGKGITVAVVSQGVSHAIEKRLEGRLTAYSVLPGDSNPYEEDDAFLGSTVGTQIVSLIGALAPQARIIAVKALDAYGGGSFEDVKNGIIRATELGAKIIVMPISAESGDDPGVTAAVNAALAKGILIASSAGNSSTSGAQYPANMNGVVAIGSVDAADKVAPYSNYGGKILFAPGSDIKAAGKSDLQYGTSHAAGVAGAIFAILWSQNPNLTYQQLVDLVLKTAKDISDPKASPAKRINGQAALQAIQKTVP